MIEALCLSASQAWDLRPNTPESKWLFLSAKWAACQFTHLTPDVENQVWPGVPLGSLLGPLTIFYYRHTWHKKTASDIMFMLKFALHLVVIPFGERFGPKQSTLPTPHPHPPRVDFRAGSQFTLNKKSQEKKCTRAVPHSTNTAHKTWFTELSEVLELLRLRLISPFTLKASDTQRTLPCFITFSAEVGFVFLSSVCILVVQP